jgi:ribonuclease E
MSDMFEPSWPDALTDEAAVLMSPRRDDGDPEDEDGFGEIGGSEELDDEFDDIEDLEDEDEDDLDEDDEDDDLDDDDLDDLDDEDDLDDLDDEDLDEE